MNRIRGRCTSRSRTTDCLVETGTCFQSNPVHNYIAYTVPRVSTLSMSRDRYTEGVLGFLQIYQESNCDSKEYIQTFPECIYPTTSPQTDSSNQCPDSVLRAPMDRISLSCRIPERPDPTADNEPSSATSLHSDKVAHFHRHI